MQGNDKPALANLRTAVELNASFLLARRYLATLLVRLGFRDESLPFFRAELTSDDGRSWIRDLTTAAMGSRNLSLAGEYATIAAELRWGRPSLDPNVSSALPEIPKIPLSIPKLRHDLAQFLYLQKRQIFGNEYDAVIRNYRRVLDGMLENGGIDARAEINGQNYDLIRHVYNRLAYLRPTNRVGQALSNKWNAADVERQYIRYRPGITVVDEFLSKEALDGVRRFCLESTVWFHNRYAYGRLGAFFQDGFNCPLLLQIAEELRERLPRVISKKYALRQMWGFKNTQPLPADVTTHADFAAINVNFWITPEDANLDETSGGLVIYDVDAPIHWDFNSYNGSDLVKPYLRRQNSKAVTIPYHQNRAIIFNSDLFHGTDAVSFKPEYENHRINVTMLYGDREDDHHHRHLARSNEYESSDTSTLWVSSPLMTLRKAHL